MITDGTKSLAPCDAECGKSIYTEDNDLRDYVKQKGWSVIWKDDRNNADFDVITVCPECVSRIIREHIIKPQIVPETPEGEIKPCPFCGCSKIDLKHKEGETLYGCDRHYFAKCHRCHAQSTRAERRDDAIAAWNRRAR